MAMTPYICLNNQNKNIPTCRSLRTETTPSKKHNKACYHSIQNDPGTNWCGTVHLQGLPNWKSPFDSVLLAQNQRGC